MGEQNIFPFRTCFPIRNTGIVPFWSYHFSIHSEALPFPICHSFGVSKNDTLPFGSLIVDTLPSHMFTFLLHYPRGFDWFHNAFPLFHSTSYILYSEWQFHQEHSIYSIQLAHSNAQRATTAFFHFKFFPVKKESFLALKTNFYLKPVHESNPSTEMDSLESNPGFYKRVQIWAPNFVDESVEGRSIEDGGDGPGYIISCCLYSTVPQVIIEQ
jgi:hypothetical protein